MQKAVFTLKIMEVTTKETKNENLEATRLYYFLRTKNFNTNKTSVIKLMLLLNSSTDSLKKKLLM